MDEDDLNGEKNDAAPNTRAKFSVCIFLVRFSSFFLFYFFFLLSLLSMLVLDFEPYLHIFICIRGL